MSIPDIVTKYPFEPWTGKQVRDFVIAGACGYQRAADAHNVVLVQIGKMVDALLEHCSKEGGECSECSRIICPHGDPFHFHHDGCPSCL